MSIFCSLRGPRRWDVAKVPGQRVPETFRVPFGFIGASLALAETKAISPRSRSARRTRRFLLALPIYFASSGHSAISGTNRTAARTQTSKPEPDIEPSRRCRCIPVLIRAGGVQCAPFCLFIRGPTPSRSRRPAPTQEDDLGCARHEGGRSDNRDAAKRIEHQQIVAAAGIAQCAHRRLAQATTSWRPGPAQWDKRAAKESLSAAASNRLSRVQSVAPGVRRVAASKCASTYPMPVPCNVSRSMN